MEKNKHKIEFFGSIGSQIKEARIAKGMLQHALAQKLNISRASLINIESGRHNVSIYMLYEIAYQLDIDVIQLIPDMNLYIKNFRENINVDIFKVTASDLRQAEEGAAVYNEERIIKSVDQFIKKFNKSDESSNNQS